LYITNSSENFELTTPLECSEGAFWAGRESVPLPKTEKSLSGWDQERDGDSRDVAVVGVRVTLL
jgi:hypothetical protein